MINSIIIWEQIYPYFYWQNISACIYMSEVKMIVWVFNIIWDDQFNQPPHHLKCLIFYCFFSNEIVQDISSVTILIFLTLFQVIWEESFKKKMFRSGWPMSIFVGDCLDYISWSRKTHLQWLTPSSKQLKSGMYVVTHSALLLDHDAAFPAPRAPAIVTSIQRWIIA